MEISRYRIYNFVTKVGLYLEKGLTLYCMK